jgi:hypothetical protein
MKATAKEEDDWPESSGRCLPGRCGLPGQPLQARWPSPQKSEERQRTPALAERAGCAIDRAAGGAPLP